MPRKEVDLSALLDEFLTAASPDIKDLAEEAGLSYAAVRSWITGRRTPRDSNVVQLLQAWERRKAEADRLARELRRASQP
jgi:predicted transcriptional regulator